MSTTVRVAAAVLRDASGQVLIAQRPPGKHMAGYWEFPGGKIDAHESAQQALARELSEEIGVALRRCRPLLQLQHEYADRVVALEVFLVDEYTGEPQPLEQQRLKWVAPAALLDAGLLPADRPIAEELARMTQA